MTHLEHFAAEQRKAVTRRWFFKECGVGLGAIALSKLLAENSSLAAELANPLAPKAPHFTPKAKNVIFLFMAGAPSHLELFDYKPKLEKFGGTLPPPELLKDYRAAFINPQSKLLAPKFKYSKSMDQCVNKLKSSSVPSADSDALDIDMDMDMDSNNVSSVLSQTQQTNYLLDQYHDTGLISVLQYDTLNCMTMIAFRFC